MRPIKKKNYFFNNYEEFLESELKDNHPLVGIEQIKEIPKDYQDFLQECKDENSVELNPKTLLGLSESLERYSLENDSKQDNYSYIPKQQRDIIYHIHIVEEQDILIVVKNNKKKTIAFLYARTEHAHYIFTKEEYRGRGIGKRLYQLAIEYFPEFKHDTPNMLQTSLSLACTMYFKTNYQEVIRINKERINK